MAKTILVENFSWVSWQ